jgi:cytochrome c oxidase subunit II
VRRTWIHGSRAVVLLGALTVALTGCSAHDAEKYLRFGWPTGVTKQAEEMRVLWSWAGVAALVLGVIMWGLMFWCCLRYRAKDEDTIPRQFKYNLGIEITCFVIPLLVITGLFYRTVVVEDNVNALSAHPDVLVKVVGFKWNWQFEYMTYRDAAGTVQTAGYPGQRDPRDSSQPYYASTVGSNSEIPVLVLPVGESVQVIEQAADVVHSFWVPEFLFKRDVIPWGAATPSARLNRFEFTATSTGSFVGRCAELCGTYHSQMNFEVRIVEPSVFLAYIAALEKIGPSDPARQSKALITANVPGGPYATTTHPFDTSRTTRSATQTSGG